MPMEQLLVQSLDELTTQIDTACQKGRRVYLYFSGSTDLTTGDSWSPECCQCEGVLEQAMKGTKEEDLFLMVEIGDQNEWNDANNKYRTHPLYQVKQLPTLLSLSFLQGQTQVASRLEGEPCLNLENVQKLFKGN